MATAISTETVRVIYRCLNKDCKHIWAFDYHVHTFVAAGRNAYELLRVAEVKGIPSYIDSSHDARCPECKSIRVRASEVEGYYSEGRVCDARCTNAHGPLCECSCGGANHGASYVHS